MSINLILEILLMTQPWTLTQTDTWGLEILVKKMFPDLCLYVQKHRDNLLNSDTVWHRGTLFRIATADCFPLHNSTLQHCRESGEKRPDPSLTYTGFDMFHWLFCKSAQP